MIFQALNELYDRLRGDSGYQIASPGRSPQKVGFKVVLRPDGSLFEIADVRDHSGRVPKALQVEVLGNTKASGAGLNPCFLWDNTQYMLGVKATDDGPEKAERTAAAFAAFRDFHLDMASEIDDAGYRAVCNFLSSWNPDEHRDNPILLDAGATGYGVFQVLGETRYVHQSRVIQDWWDTRPGESNSVTGQCLVTGNFGALARTHDKIKGVVGGQGAGGTIAGFNDAAYESHGLTQSFNAPVSERAAFRYVTALNALLDGPQRARHRILLGDTTLAFWTEAPSEFETFFTQFLVAGEEIESTGDPAQDELLRARIHGVLEAVRRGHADPGSLVVEGSPIRYHLLALSPNSGRISVRFHHRGALEDLIRHLAAHYRDLMLARRSPTSKWRGDPEFPSLRDLLDQTARARKDIPPLLGPPTLKAVLQGDRYPQALYAAVLRRIAADREITYLRGCILKAYLNRNLKQGLSMALDTSRSDPAYRMGRLFAALEKTQEDALEGIKKTIRDTYYGAASATPRTVFPRLLRTYQHHLSKLEGGRRVMREKLVQEILEPLSGFPPHLDLKGQGLFAIGYYHQRDAFFTKSEKSVDA